MEAKWKSILRSDKSNFKKSCVPCPAFLMIWGCLSCRQLGQVYQWKSFSNIYSTTKPRLSTELAYLTSSLLTSSKDCVSWDKNINFRKPGLLSSSHHPVPASAEMWCCHQIQNHLISILKTAHFFIWDIWYIFCVLLWIKRVFMWFPNHCILILFTFYTVFISVCCIMLLNLFPQFKNVDVL